MPTGSPELSETPHTVSPWPGSTLYCLKDVQSSKVLAPTPRHAQQPLAFISTDTPARGHTESVSVGPPHRKRPLGPAFYTDNIAPDYPGCSGPACLQTPCWGGGLWLSHEAHSLQPASATTVSQNRTSRSQRASKEGSWRDWPRTGDSEAFPLASWGWQDLPPLC